MTYAQKVAASHKRLGARRDILTMIASYYNLGQVIDVGDVADAVGCKRSTVFSALNLEAEAGRVVHVARGRYARSSPKMRTRQVPQSEAAAYAVPVTDDLGLTPAATPAAPSMADSLEVINIMVLRRTDSRMVFIDPAGSIYSAALVDIENL